MGKIRVKTFGDEEQELKEKEKQDKKREAKIAEQKAEAKLEAVVESVETKTETTEEVSEAKVEVKQKTNAAKSTKGKDKAFHSQKYLGLSQLIDKTKNYALKEALEILAKLQRGTSDETVELHINTTATGVSGSITLPHGTGKKTKVVIANDAIIAEIEKGKIDFDILLAEPSMMPKLAKVARILGPRGLMPNPKNGTITQNPLEAAKKYEGGQVNFKTEAKSPIMHLTVGKMSMGADKLSQNIDAYINAIKKSNILNVTLKSTMSPGLKIKI
jgi:large subunit ribosomal protein L1